MNYKNPRYRFFLIFQSVFRGYLTTLNDTVNTSFFIASNSRIIAE